MARSLSYGLMVESKTWALKKEEALERKPDRFNARKKP
jgi:hypothetical protein